MRRIRLAYLIPSLRAGGAERQMLALAERLPPERYDIDFLALIGRGEWDAHAEAAGARVLMLGSEPASRSPLARRAAARLGKAARYVQLVRKARYDIIDAWLYPADTFAVLMRPLTGRPVVLSGRRNVESHSLLGPFDRPLERLVSRSASAIVANSAAAARFAIASQGAEPGRVKVIRNGVESVEPPSHEEWSRLRSHLGVHDRSIVIGCVANYRPVKQHDMLIGAFAGIAAAVPDAILVLIGEGPCRADMERQVASLGISDRVRIHGAEANARPFLWAFDLVVQASQGEGLPNQLLEAAAAMRPIVATDVGGTDEIVIDGTTGLLVPPGDADAFARAMRIVIDDEGLRAHLGSGARSHVADRFGMDRFVREWDRLYQSIAARRTFRPRRSDVHMSDRGAGS